MRHRLAMKDGSKSSRKKGVIYVERTAKGQKHDMKKSHENTRYDKKANFVDVKICV